MADLTKGNHPIWRSLLDHPLWQDKPFAKGQAWVDMILQANHTEKKWLVGNEIETIKPGEFITSQAKLSERWGWSRQRVRGFLNSLQKATSELKPSISVNSTKQRTKINLLNYKYLHEKATKRATFEQPTNNQDPFTTKECKELKEGIKGPTDKKEPPNPNIKIFLDWWFKRFGEIFNQKYLINGGKEGKIVKKLLETHNFEKLKGLAEMFFKSDDPFVEKAGYTIGVFASQINKLATQAPKQLDPDIYDLSG